MLVSSYNMYIDNVSTQRTQNKKSSVLKTSTKPFFVEAQSKAQTKSISLNNSLPINYISKYKILNNRQALQRQELAANTPKMKFTKISSINNAQVAYGENSKMFSLFIKPKPTLNQTPKSALKNTMINTYIANENYYKITA